MRNFRKIIIQAIIIMHNQAKELVKCALHVKIIQDFLSKNWLCFLFCTTHHLSWLKITNNLVKKKTIQVDYILLEDMVTDFHQRFSYEMLQIAPMSKTILKKTTIQFCNRYYALYKIMQQLVFFYELALHIVHWKTMKLLLSFDLTFIIIIIMFLCGEQQFWLRFFHYCFFIIVPRGFYRYIYLFNFWEIENIDFFIILYIYYETWDLWFFFVQLLNTLNSKFWNVLKWNFDVETFDVKDVWLYTSI